MMKRLWQATLFLLFAPVALAGSWFGNTSQPAQFDHFAGQLSQQLATNARYITYRTPLVVASLVDVNNLDSSGALGRVLAESLTTKLHQLGYTLVDLKGRGKINITGKGDFYLSRDPAKLNERLPVDYVLVGTYEQRPDGVQVNVRIEGIKSRVVVATASGFMENQMMGQGQRVIFSHNGFLEREGQ